MEFVDIGLDQYIYMFALNLLYVCVNWLAIVQDKRNANLFRTVIGILVVCANKKKHLLKL